MSSIFIMLVCMKKIMAMLRVPVAPQFRTYWYPTMDK